MTETARELAGRVVLITGASRNIGRTLAEEFAGAGAAVVINSRSARNEADELAAMLRARGHKAGLIRLLCTPRGRYITGQTIHVNGGSYMNA
jgi:NAD(P)-dependent dehydrogenase (short-subunit alcohol dehydrogenase family)